MYHRSLSEVICALFLALPWAQAFAQPVQPLSLFSSAIANGRPIPAVFTCDGNGTSPSLSWRNVPRHAKSLALAVDDPDAPDGDFVHWVIYDIPASAAGLKADVAMQPRFSDGITQGINSAGRTGFFAPCPPAGTHRYFFRLYALDNRPALPPGATLGQLQQTMKGHVLGQTLLMGTYAHQP